MTRDSQKFKEFINNYWKYYRELENEFLDTRKYVDFQRGNFGTYSVEFLKLYQAVCGEVDVLGKIMAASVNPAFKPDDTTNNIYKWWFEIQNSFKYFNRYSEINTSGLLLKDVKVVLLDEIELQPWKKFETEKYKDKNGRLRYRTVGKSGSPRWWSEYNKVKHARTLLSGKNSKKTNYSKANLENVIYAFAALYIMEKSYMEAIGTSYDLEAFAGYSCLFDKIENTTSADIKKMFE